MRFDLSIFDSAEQGVVYTFEDFGAMGSQFVDGELQIIDKQGPISLSIDPNNNPWVLSNDVIDSYFITAHRDEIQDFQLRFDTLNRDTGDIVGYIKFKVDKQATVEGYFAENYKTDINNRIAAINAYEDLFNPKPATAPTNTSKSVTKPSGNTSKSGTKSSGNTSTPAKKVVNPDISLGKWVQCAVCHGTGRVTCPICHGSGTRILTLSSGNLVEGCLYCGGLKTIVCSGCAGMGKKFVFAY